MNDFTIVQFMYTNYKNETALRTVRPIRIWFGSTAWHPDSQWMLEAFDLDKQETRDFAMASIHSPWLKASEHETQKTADDGRRGGVLEKETQAPQAAPPADAE